MSSSTKTASSRPFPGQHSGEHVELVFHQHPLVMRKVLIFGMVAILVSVAPLAFYQVWTYPWLTSLLIKGVIIVPILVALVWFWRWIGWYYTVYIVTDERIVEIKQKGFFNRSVGEWQLDKIMNVNYHVSGLQAVMFGFGDITVQTIIGDLNIQTVHKPIHIHEKLQEIIRRDSAGAERRRQTATAFVNR